MRENFACTVAVVEDAPRSWLQPANRAAFGRRGAASWRPASSSEERVGLAAAQLQHDVVAACRPRLEELHMSVADLADRLAVEVPPVGTKPDMLRRKFRGEARASIGDLVAWLTVLEVDRRWEFGGSLRAEAHAAVVTGAPYDRGTDGGGVDDQGRGHTTKREEVCL